MSNQNPQNTFHVGICMAGAVSAGAYTAGVMDYLIEALSEWEKRRGQPGVPTHHVQIPVIGGASAGGMTGIITAASLNNEITPVKKPGSDILTERTENKLYHAWVDLTGIDMLKKMLNPSDIKPGKVVSGLNSDFIDDIASHIVKTDAGHYKPLPPFFAANLKVFTTLTSLNGLEYNTAFRADTPASKNYYMQIHNDYACFEMTEEAAEKVKAKEKDPDFKFNNGWIPLNFKNNLNAGIARDAAMATGAFPVGLKSRAVTRPAGYLNALAWLKQATGKNPLPKGEHTTLNVDGGLINNEPFEKVQDVLTGITAQTEQESQDYNTFRSTVLMIEPFPTSKAAEFKPDQNLANVIGATLSSMISQMRSKPADIQNAMTSSCAGQFLIAPSRRVPKANGQGEINIQGELAIACGALDGFSGFINKEFRVHDYFLGRHNCKIFLRDYFTIPASAVEKNEIFKAGYAGIDKTKFRSMVDHSYQIIPVFPDANDYSFPDIKFSGGKNWPVISEDMIDAYKGDLKKRIQAIILNIGDLNKIQKFLIWAGAWLILNNTLAKKVLNAIKSDLRKWQLLKP